MRAIALQISGVRVPGLQFAAGTREAAKACKQGGETRRVLLGHGCEFQSHPFARLNVPHNRLCPDLAFLD